MSTDFFDVLGGNKTVFIDSYRFTLELERGQQGKVGWKIKMKGNDPAIIVEKVKLIQADLSESYSVRKEVKKDAVTGKTRPE